MIKVKIHKNIIINQVNVTTISNGVWVNLFHLLFSRYKLHCVVSYLYLETYNLIVYLKRI